MAPPSVEDGKLSGKFHEFHHEGVSTHNEGVSRDKAETLALLSVFVSSQMTVCGHHKSPPPRERARSAPLGSGRRLTAVLKEKC